MNSPSADSSPQSWKPKRQARDGFFAIDSRTWAKVVTLGMGPSAVYIVLARGTDAQQRLTPWSVHAVEKYTGIGRRNATKWIVALEEAGLIRQRNPGGRPVYELLPAGDVPGSGVSGPALGEKNEHLIWLPNPFVSSAAGEASPLELVRQTGDVAVLNLLVQLYADNDIADAGGIPREHISQRFNAREFGQHGQWRVLGFLPEEKITESGLAPFAQPFMRGGATVANIYGPIRLEDAGWDDFRRAWNTLIELRLIVLIPHLAEGADGLGDLVHPCAHRDGAAEENVLGVAAHDFCLALLFPNEAKNADGYTLAPVPAHRATVSMVGIFRLRYQAKTAQTRRWAARLKDWQALADSFNALAHEQRQRAKERCYATG